MVSNHGAATNSSLLVSDVYLLCVGHCTKVFHLVSIVLKSHSNFIGDDTET